MAIASSIERQLYACPTPQRPPSIFGLTVHGFCFQNTRRLCVHAKSLAVQRLRYPESKTLRVHIHNRLGN